MQNQIKDLFLVILFLSAFLNHFLSFFRIFVIKSSILTNAMHIIFVILLILILEKLSRNNQPIFFRVSKSISIF